MSKKENKKNLLKIIIPLAAVLIIFILGCFAFLNMWTVRPSEDINSIKLSVLDGGGYSDFIIAEKAEIFGINELFSDLQNGMNITNMKAVRAAEKFQKDPEFAVIFDYGGSSREICVHKDTVVIFNENRTYFLQLEDMDTAKLRDKLNSYKG